MLILICSTELDKSYESFMASTRTNNSINSTKAYSPRTSYHPNSQHATGNGTGMAKLPPTGPRAYKKPRLSESQASPPLRTNMSLPPHKLHNQSHGSSRSSDMRDYNTRRSAEGRGKHNHIKMDPEDDSRGRPPSPVYERDRVRDRDRERERGLKDRDRERDRDRDRDRERERDGNRPSRRGGNFGGNISRGGNLGRRAERVVASADTLAGGDRTLAERMGL